MKYYLIAGEASGDLHGSNLIRELKSIDPAAEFRCWGGEMMSQAGGEVVKHYRDLAYMGFWEVLLNIKTILDNFKFCKEDIRNFKPDVVILIDYPGFNLRLARYLKKKEIKVFYYISPQVWAWYSSRVKKIKKLVDRMFVILPFEKPFYEKWQYEVDFVGHPLLDAIASRKSDPDFYRENNLEQKPVIALLPGSRKQEVKRILPVMLAMVQAFPGYQFVVGGRSTLGREFYEQFIHHRNAKLLIDQTYELLEHAHAGLVTSGTATLETALFNVPQVVCYKGGLISYLIGKNLVNVEYISLVNLVMEKEVVQELIQSDFNTETLKAALQKILKTEERKSILEDYDQLKEKLGSAGASGRAANLMYQYLTE